MKNTSFNLLNMTKYISLFVFFILTASFHANAQTQNCVDSSEVYFVVDEMPEYLGGEQELQKFLVTNLFSHPELSGKGCGKVYIHFCIEIDGRISDVRPFRPCNPVLDAECMRVVWLTSGKWKCGRLKGKPVRVQYVLPFNACVLMREID